MNRNIEFDLKPESVVQMLSGYLSLKHNKVIRVQEQHRVYKPGYHEDDDVKVEFFYQDGDKPVYLYPNDVEEILKGLINENYDIARMIYDTDITQNNRPVFHGVKLFLTEKEVKHNMQP